MRSLRIRAVLFRLLLVCASPLSQPYHRCNGTKWLLLPLEGHMATELRGRVVSVMYWVHRRACYRKSLYLQSHISFHKSGGRQWSKLWISFSISLCLLVLACFRRMYAFFNVPDPARKGPQDQIPKKDRVRSGHMELRR